MNTGGDNLIGDNRGSEGLNPAGIPNTNGDRVGSGAGPIDPLLTPSGTTPLYYTFDLASEAYGNGSNSAITTELFGSIPEDQRGRPRIDGTFVDIGAVEMDYLLVIDTDDSGSALCAIVSTPPTGAATARSSSPIPSSPPTPRSPSRRANSR